MNKQIMAMRHCASDNQWVVCLTLAGLGVQVWYPTKPTRNQIRKLKKAMRNRRRDFPRAPLGALIYSRKLARFTCMPEYL